MQHKESVRRVFPVFAPLEGDERYKGGYGGRGSGKSHYFAEKAINRCFQATTRIVCIREIQKTLRESVRQLLIDKIQAFGLGYFFQVLDAEIRSNFNDSIIIFQGMQSHNAESIKSLEGFDIAWVEEAQTLSAHSLKLLRPTLRKPGSELWFSWNPRNRTDAVDAFFRKNPPANAVSVLANWQDNPIFPDELKEEKDHDFATDPDEAEHIWEGAYGMQKGAILARWVNRAYKEGRINDEVSYDPDIPVEISSDLGRRDTATWWFWQRKVGGYSLIDYDQGYGLYAGDWVKRIQAHLKEKNYRLGRIWLPHDARTKTFAAKHSAIHQFVKGDPDEGIRGFGAKYVKIVPKTSIQDRINAGRTIIQRCEFNETLCADGIDGLLAWEYEFDEEKGIFSKDPVHNWASHPSDGYTYGCQVMQTEKPPEDDDKSPKWWHEQTAKEVFWPKETPAQEEWV